MAAATIGRRRTAKRPTRAERSDEIARNLFDAAIKVVGRYGYAEASVARITQQAGVAQGTFYNYFQNRQELLDQLLPTLGERMRSYIRDRQEAPGVDAEPELTRFVAFFDFLKETPEFLRILNEAELFAPAGYEQHLELTADGYTRLLKRERKGGLIKSFSDAELEAIVYMLMGAREYLSRRFPASDDERSAAIVASAYGKLLRGGLLRS